MKKHQYALSFLLYILFRFCPETNAQETPNEFSYFIDTSNTKTLLTLQKSKFTKLDPANENTLNLNTSNFSIWESIKINETKQDLILTIENPHLDSVHIYYLSNGHLIRHLISGDRTPFGNRFIESNFLNYKIEKGTTEIILNIKSKGIVLIPVKIFEFKEYYNYYQNYTKWHWLYFGILFLTVISNLLFFIWLKESIYLYYILCVISIGIVTALDFEYTFQYLWPNNPDLNQYNTAYYSVYIFSFLFMEKLLEIRTKYKVVYYFYFIFYLLAFVMVIFSVSGEYNLAWQSLIYISPLIPITTLSIGIYSYIKERTEVAKFFLLGWSTYFICFLIYILTFIKVFPITAISNNLIPIGSTIEIIFLNLAILSRINALKKEKETILAQQNHFLEEKVKERTSELHQKSDEVLAQNEELLSQQMEVEAQRDSLEKQNKIIEEQNLLLKGSKESLEKIIEHRTEELKHTNDDLIEYNNRLEQFAFITAHNLRGPVSTLLGLAQIYNRENLSDPTNLTILDKSNETTKKLDSIIRDLGEILDLQKANNHLISTINLTNVVQDVTVLVSNEIETSKAIIRTNFTSDTSIKSISAYINNIFYNLISNAIKYSRENVPPIITITYSENNGNTCLIFEDNGIGIDLSKFGSKIFHPYKRFHVEKQGKGLGLYIVKTQVEILKGKIKLESQPNVGSIFTIELPIVSKIL